MRILATLSEMRIHATTWVHAPGARLVPLPMLATPSRMPRASQLLFSSAPNWERSQLSQSQSQYQSKTMRILAMLLAMKMAAIVRLLAPGAKPALSLQLAIPSKMPRIFHQLFSNAQSLMK
jgi:hypothetical protein